MKKIFYGILLTAATAFAIDAPISDIKDLAKYLDKNTQYRTSLYGQCQCKIDKTFNYYGKFAVRVWCMANHGLAYSLPERFGQLKMTDVSTDGFGSYATYTEEK